MAGLLVQRAFLTHGGKVPPGTRRFVDIVARQRMGLSEKAQRAQVAEDRRIAVSAWGYGGTPEQLVRRTESIGKTLNLSAIEVEEKKDEKRNPALFRARQILLGPVGSGAKTLL